MRVFFSLFYFFTWFRSIAFALLLVEIFLSSFRDILKVDFRSSQFWRTVTSLYRLFSINSYLKRRLNIFMNENVNSDRIIFGKKF